MPALTVTVERVAYPPATKETDGGNAWYILITNHGACKGKIPWRPEPKEMLILHGEWGAYNGEKEFKFKTAKICLPKNERDQLHYICERTSGMGPAMEALIWEKCGENWKAIAAGDVPRLHGALFQEFQVQLEVLLDKSAEVEIVAALMGKGATLNMAIAAFVRWKMSTLGIVNSDCYRLAELRGYGFADVDKTIRVNYGIADTDKRRIKSAVLYSIRRLTDSGDTVIDWSDLFQLTSGMLGGHEDLICDCTRELFEAGELRSFPESEGVALKHDFVNESAILDFF